MILLQAQSIKKSFGGLQALSGVSLEINENEIFGLIGPNGAGKTTFFNVLTGLYPPDSGKFIFDGSPLKIEQPYQITAQGIARTFQNIRLFANMTVLENVMIGRHVRTKAGIVGAILRDEDTVTEEKAILESAKDWLEYVGLETRAYDLAKHLSYGDQRRLEIARALATSPKLLALDEPAAGMNTSETLGLRGLLEKICASGITILLVEHDMKLVMHLCDRIVVLDYGKKIAEGTPAEIQCDSKVIEAYLGGSIAAGT